MVDGQTSSIKYIAKPDTWFDEGSEATLLGELWNDYRDAKLTIKSQSGLFLGYKNGKLDEEVCCIDEFIEIRGESL